MRSFVELGKLPQDLQERARRRMPAARKPEPRGSMWCGHGTEFSITDDRGVEVCGPCSMLTAELVP